jgi:hypothetical protein
MELNSLTIEAVRTAIAEKQTPQLHWLSSSTPRLKSTMPMFTRI